MKKRYWLILGLIFSVIAFFVSIPGILMMLGFSPNIFGGPNLISSVSLFIIYPVLYPIFAVGMLVVFKLAQGNAYLATLILALIPSIFYFIIGVIVGGIYGKIKNRKIPNS